MASDLFTLSFGANPIENGGTRFRVWAPFAKEAEVHLPDGKTLRAAPMESAGRGCFEAILEGTPPGTRYLFRLDRLKNRPDPYSRCQPQGVHGPSQIIDPNAFDWSDSDWNGIPIEDFIIYELHAGTFTAPGTFNAILPRLNYLKNQLGATAIEIMPAPQFPGDRNWGYDGVYLFAPHSGYGGPEGLKRLVNACHIAGLAVILDVVYNHVGLEGNYLRDFGPYFTEKYRTPWGEAIDYDGAGSDFVRRFVIDNALYWLTEYHIDALRLDAVHAIYDFSAKHILREMKEEVEKTSRRLNKPIYLIAESDLNDPKIIDPPERGGYGLDAQWNDDYHHCLHTLLTRERSGYYRDFGRLDQMGRAITDGFVIAGAYSYYRDRIHGRAPSGLPASKFIIFAQNHDQAGNRILGERLSALAPFEALKTAAAAVLLSPNIPLLFMGEEYGDPAPFLFFTDYQDPGLAERVRRGRREEAIAFGWKGALPDPQAEETFLKSKIDLALRYQEQNAALFSFYRKLLSLRKSEAALRAGAGKVSVERFEDEQCLVIKRGEGTFLIFLSFNPNPASLSLRLSPGTWEKRLDSEEKIFGGNEGRLLPAALREVEVGLDLSPYQAAVYNRAP